MAGTQKVDKYANIAALAIGETVINTMASAKFAFPFSIMDKVGLVISRIEYFLSSVTGLDGNGDAIFLALAASASVADIAVQNDPLIIDNVKWQRADHGVAASAYVWQAPLIKDFASLPGGGLLVAPNPLYAIIKGLGEASVASAWIKLFYTYIELSTDEYWQLVESRRIISS